MSEQIREDLRTRTYVDLARGIRVTQYVATKVWGLHASYPSMLDENVAYCGCSTERPEGHLHTNEQVPGGRLWWTAVTEVACQHLGYSGQ